MIKISIKYAVLCGIFLMVSYHISVFFNSNPLIDVSHLIFDLILFGLFIFFGQKEFKTYQSEGVFHFWQGMTMGFLIYSIAAIVFGIGLYGYFLMEPEAIEIYKEEALTFLQERSDMFISEFGEQRLIEQKAEIEAITKVDLLKSAMVKKILAGFFITPVISIILRKQPK